jgi:hypothetical protein
LRLPNPARAVVDISKLRDYCLDLSHPDGKHKARVFIAALGILQTDSDWLRERLLEAAHLDATALMETAHGSLYMIDFDLRTRHGAAKVRSGWIVRATEDFPRLTTCFVVRDQEKLQ